MNMFWQDNVQYYSVCSVHISYMYMLYMYMHMYMYMYMYMWFLKDRALAYRRAKINAISKNE